jgi:cobalt-zinc-cadmium efflux system outer membrane protein
VGILQRLEIAGQHALRLRTAEARRLVFESLLGETRWAVRVEVQRLFARILLMRERVRHAQRFVEFAEAMSRIAGRQVELGESSPLVRLVANVELAQAQAMLVEARQAKRSLRHQLAGVVGWPSPELPEVEGDLPAVQPALSARQLLALMAEHHPALRTRELAVLAGREHLRSANRDAVPSPTVGVAYESEAAPTGEGRHQSWTVRMIIPLPLWSQNQVARARAEAELVLADREREETITRLRVEVREATSALNAAAERVTLYQNAVVPQLEENLVRLERAYELGEVGAHEVFQTRARLLEGISGYIDARVAYFDAAAALKQVVGTEISSTDGMSGRLTNESGEER